MKVKSGHVSNRMVELSEKMVSLVKSKVKKSEDAIFDDVSTWLDKNGEDLRSSPEQYAKEFVKDNKKYALASMSLTKTQLHEIIGTLVCAGRNDLAVIIAGPHKKAQWLKGKSLGVWTAVRDSSCRSWKKGEVRELFDVPELKERCFVNETGGITYIKNNELTFWTKK